MNEVECRSEQSSVADLLNAKRAAREYCSGKVTSDLVGGSYSWMEAN